MDTRIANARALGFASFATGAWMYFMAVAGWFPETELSSATMTMMGLATNLGLLIAGLASFFRKDHWAAFFFTFWAGVWWGSHAASVAVEGSVAYAGFSMATLAVVSVILFLAAVRDPEALPVRLVAIGTALTFVIWALAAWGLGDFFAHLAGYIGLLTALAAYWAAAAEALGGEVGKGGAGTATAAPPPAGGAM